jgi:hypothetical protein
MCWAGAARIQARAGHAGGQGDLLFTVGVETGSKGDGPVNHVAMQPSKSVFVPPGLIAILCS